MQNIYIVHLSNRDTGTSYNLVGVYSNKELADAAGFEACEMRPNSQHTVTIKALDDIIDGLNN